MVGGHADTIGLITEVVQGAAHVDPDPGLTDTIRSKLGWEGDPGPDGYVLQEATIDKITEDEVWVKRYD